ncbi:FecR family protein [Chitinophaga sp. 30R24]|uniref:FecR family protein n=1 Tax=Chitinophaga sp. 30R24 TaxID=3248838 RepID=UPI003B8F5B44
MIPSFPNEAMPEEALYTLLCKYLLNEADAQERAWVEDWKGIDPGNIALLNSLGEVLHTVEAEEKVAVANTDAAWLQLYEKMGCPEDNHASHSITTTLPVAIPARTPVRFTWLKVAAMLLVVLGAGWWYLHANRPQAIYTGPIAATLLDGSSVQLLAASRLEVAHGFNEKNRKVSLSGTASFDVRNNPAHPFIIVLGHTEVKVLGTRFTIAYQPGGAALKVHVSSGKVIVIDHAQADSVVLTEGMLLQEDNNRPVFRIAAYVTDMDKKSLSFHDVSLEEVLHTVTEVYDIKVEVTDTDLLKLPVHADFAGESTEDVIKSLALMLNANYEKINERQYKLNRPADY